MIESLFVSLLALDPGATLGRQTPEKGSSMWRVDLVHSHSRSIYGTSALEVLERAIVALKTQTLEDALFPATSEEENGKG